MAKIPSTQTSTKILQFGVIGVSVALLLLLLLTSWVTIAEMLFLLTFGTAMAAIGAVMVAKERQRAAAAIAESETRLRLALQAGHMGIWDWDLLTNALQWSDELTALYGLEPGKFGGRLEHFLALVDLRDRNRVMQAIDRAVQAGSPYEEEFRITWADGSIHWMVSKGKIFQDETGRAVRMMGVGMDITDRKEAEIQLKQANERFELAAAAIKGVIYDWNFATMRVERTKGLMDVVGYLPEEAEPTVEWWNHRIHPDDRPQIDSKAQEIAVAGDGFTMEYRVQHRDGQYRHVWDRGLIERDHEGQIVRVVGCNLDVSDRVRAEQAKDDFLATLSHELRTPLNAILGWLQMLTTRKLDQVMAGQALETIHRNARSLSDIIDDLLDVSRIVTSKLHLETRSLNLLAVLEATIEALQTTAADKNIALNFTAPANLPFVLGDSNRLQQVFANLVANAIKFTPLGGQVQICCDFDSTFVQVQVIDNGVGIAPEFLPYLFDRFRQADSSSTRHFGGLGLGLAIVHHLVEMHQGTIQAISEGEDQGATFVVKLPIAEIIAEITDSSPE
jgi:PAS domain S-box-containing protein